MINLIPSKQVSEYLDEIGRTFSDYEKTILIWNSERFPTWSKREMLMDLAKTTDDMKTKQLIEAHLDEEGKMLDRFVSIPYPPTFMKGIPVKYICASKFEIYGIIAIGIPEWEIIEQRIKYGFLGYDDMYITVVFLEDDGRWRRKRVNPIYLEVGMPNTADNPYLAYALEALSDYWSGSGSEETVLKYCRRYAESKKETGMVDKATSLDDIIC